MPVRDIARSKTAKILAEKLEWLDGGGDPHRIGRNRLVDDGEGKEVKFHQL